MEAAAHPIIPERFFRDDCKPLGDRANGRERSLLGAILAHADHLAEDVKFLDGVPIALHDHVCFLARKHALPAARKCPTVGATEPARFRSSKNFRREMRDRSAAHFGPRYHSC
jgi:hypothetical protein